ncbi:MAG: endoglucanase [Caulobacterales bacterium]
MRLRPLLRALVAATVMAAVTLSPLASAAVGAGAGGLAIRVGQAEDFSHIEFHWAGSARMTTKRQGQTLVVSFNRDAKPDLSLLRSVPVKWLKGAEAKHGPGGLSIVLTLADDADAKAGEADGADFVNLFQKKDAGAAPAAQASQTPPPTRPDPVPTGGVVPIAATLTGPQVRLDFPWRNPCGAAVFRRGDAIWIVFDAAAKIDVSHAPSGVPQYVSIQSLGGQGYSAVRIVTRAPVAFVAQSDGSTWSVILEPFNQPPYTPAKVARSDTDGPASLIATLAGATGVFWIDDPAVGDRLAVVTALAPAKGEPVKRDFVQLSLLQSAQGLAVDPHADDLAVTFSGDLVTLTRPAGLTLSSRTDAKLTAAPMMDAPRPAAMPALISDDWSRLGAGGFLARYDALMTPVAEEEAQGSDGKAGAHLALARFLIGQQLSYEAIGVLNDALRLHPQLGSQAEFRGLRGIAKVMAGRYKEADTDFSAPVLADDPSSAMWRGYIAVKLSQWADAKRDFADGAGALDQFSPTWKARFGRAAAETSLAQGDTQTARSWIAFTLTNPVEAVEQLRTRMVQARLLEAEGNPDAALRMYQILQTAPGDDISGPALLHATEIQLAKGQITPLQAASTFDGLRFRWRGGGFELETIRALGQLYLSQGRYREALEALRSAGKNLPDLPEAVQLQADLGAAFKSLFLDGQADGLEPIQALALFYDFKELTPVGADGDMMVRRLTRRLVDVDLLPQAEDLLKYQVENRLDGVSKAQVATDLAVIYLMDRRPEDALGAIDESRTTILPNALNMQRRVLAARALTGLGRYDAALEMLGGDNTPDGVDARAEIAWKQKAWPQAGAITEKQLGERYKTAGPLSAQDEGKLLRAAVAFSLAGDDVSLTRLRSRFAGFVDGSRSPDALRVALSGVSDGRLSVADFGRLNADAVTFEGWVAKMKDRFRQAAPPAPRPPFAAGAVAADTTPPPKGPPAKAQTAKG